MTSPSKDMYYYAVERAKRPRQSLRNFISKREERHIAQLASLVWNRLCGLKTEATMSRQVFQTNVENAITIAFLGCRNIQRNRAVRIVRSLIDEPYCSQVTSRIRRIK